MTYFPAYFKKKAENLATKEDIAEITAKVEGVKVEYLGRIESLKARLDKGKYVHKRQFDLELDVYKSLWKQLVTLREATAALRPIMDVAKAEGESDEDRKRKRAEQFSMALTPFSTTVEDNRPFYAPEVWQKLLSLRDLTWKEAVNYRFSDERRVQENYWEQAEKNMKAIGNMSDEICEAIRSRISHLNEAYGRSITTKSEVK